MFPQHSKFYRLTILLMDRLRDLPQPLILHAHAFIELIGQFKR